MQLGRVSLRKSIIPFIKKFYLATNFLVMGLLASCSSLEKWVGEDRNHREFQLRNVWVQQGSEKDNLGFRKVNRMMPLLLGKILLQGNSIDGLAAYDLENGNEMWRLPITNGIEGSAALHGKTLYLGALDGQFYSIQADKGKVNWTFPLQAEFLSEPLLQEGALYFLSGNNVVYALEASTGKQLWMYSRQDTSSLSIRGGSKPAFYKGQIFLGFSDGALVSLNAKNGSINWELQLNKGKKFRDVDATPIVDENLIYVSSYDDRLYCINADRGEIIWNLDGGGFNAVTLLNDKIFYPTTNGEIVALKKSTGEKLWTYKSNHGVATSIRLYKGFLLFGESQGGLVFLSPQTGLVRSEFYPGRGILATPQIDEANHQIYFISGEANIYAMEAKWDWPGWFPFLK